MYQIKKSVCLNGKLKQGLSYTPCPSSEFSNSLSKIAIGSISFSSKELIKERCIISCNFVKSQRYRTDIEYYEEPLALFLLETNSKSPTNLNQFETHWFEINSLSSELKFTVKTHLEKTIDKDCDLSILVFFA